MKKILVTGSAGFIGHHLAITLRNRGDEVTGLDCLNDYYDINLKYERLRVQGIDKDDIQYNHLVEGMSGINFIKLKMEDRENMESFFAGQQFDVVVNLAAQAGVRHSIDHPHDYIDSNIVGFLNILEGCRHTNVKHLVYASSSSVYGANKKMPFKTTDNVDHPLALYAASKKSNELMAHSYSHLFSLATTGLRFFTVYGPWGRPDMALFLFTDAMLKGNPIKVFNYGDMKRDFTYIDDIIEGVVRVIDRPPKYTEPDPKQSLEPGSSYAPFKIYNIGNNDPTPLMDFIHAIEEKLGIEAKKELLPMQPGDVPASFADVSDLMRDVDFKPNTSVQEGINKFIDWYLEYYDNKSI